MRKHLDIRGFFQIVIPPVIYVIIQRIAGYVVVFGMTLMSFGAMTVILRGRSFSVNLDWNEMGFVAMALAALVICAGIQIGLVGSAEAMQTTTEGAEQTKGPAEAGTIPATAADRNELLPDAKERE